MCLYEQILKNPRYEISIKNGGNVPEPKDERQRYIRIRCGWCKECRKEIANEWKARLYEELKGEKKKAYFVTFSISADYIAKLEKNLHEKKIRGIEGEDTDVNILAAYAVRMFTERWRKKYKRAPKHWLTTELGHKNSERIHLHGIIFNNTDKGYAEVREDIIEKWKYGNVFIGHKVDNKTINYITKYITKTDKIHKGYKQKIFSSKGMGAQYPDKNRQLHSFNHDQTITYYTDSRGTKMKLPAYWKKKLWTEEERQYLWSLQMDQMKLRVNNVEWDTTRQDEEEYRTLFQNMLEKARETNMENGYGSPTFNNRRYIITELMKMNYRSLKEAIKNNEKIVKWVPKRESINTIKREFKNNTEMGKHQGTTTEIYGDYIGTTTETERKRNAERAEARALKVTVKQLRLIKAGIITNLA